MNLRPLPIKPGWSLIIKTDDFKPENVMIEICKPDNSPAIEMLSTCELLVMQKSLMTSISDSWTWVFDPDFYPENYMLLPGMIKFLDFINDILLKRHQDHIS